MIFLLVIILNIAGSKSFHGHFFPTKAMASRPESTFKLMTFRASQQKYVGS